MRILKMGMVLAGMVLVMMVLTGIVFLSISGGYAAEKNQVLPALSNPNISINEPKIASLVPASYNWIRNGSFESALNGTSPDGWSVSSGTANLGIDTSEKRVGSYSLSIENAQGLIVSQSINDLNGLKEGKIAFGAWVKSIIPGQVQLLVDYAGTQYTSESNTGIGDWEFLKVEVPAESEDNQLKVGIAVNSKEAVAIDGAVLYPAAKNLVFTPNPQDDLKMPSGLIYTDLENQTVGIGTKNPQEKLDVAGNVNVAGAGKVAGDLSVLGNLIVDGKISTKGSLQAESIIDPTGTNLLGLGAWNQNETSVYLKDSSKNVGIGTMSPGIKFQVNTAGVAADETQARFVNPKPGNTYSNIELGFNTNDGQSSPIGRIRTFSIDGNPGTQSGRMYLQTMLTGIWQDGVTILENGNVGIGTTSPARILDLSANPMELVMRNSAGTVDNRVWRLAQPASGILGIEAMNDTLTSGTNVINFTRTGNVGIGTTNPGAKLDVNGALNANNVYTTVDASGLLTLGRYNSDYPWVLIRPDSTATGIEFRSNAGTPFVNINQSSGNVGIGTTAPRVKLDVNGSIQLPDDTAWGKLVIGNYGSYLSRQASDGSTILQTGQSSLLLNPTSGNVGIGTTSPAAKLHISDSVSPTVVRIESTAVDGSAQLNINSAAAGYPHILFTQGGVGRFEMGQVTNNGNFYFNNNTQAGESSAAMVISKAGNVGIGTTTPSKKLTLDVGGNSDGINVLGTYNPSLLLGNVSSGDYGKISYFYDPSLGNRMMFGTPGAVMHIKGSGVGINKIPSMYSLEVNGYTQTSGLCLGDDCRTTWPTGGGSSGESLWSDSGSGIYYYGDVGVGTAPQSGYKLNVFGITKMSVGTAGYTLEVTNTSTYPTASAISGYGHDTIGVQGQSYGSDGVHAESASGYGIFATSTNNYAGYFAGNTNTTGTTYTGELEITGGADIAEPFEVLSDKIVELGSVVIIDSQNPGKLTLSNREYDKRVAGVVSGAGGIRSGLKLRQKESLDKGIDVALTGRVYVRANTSNGTIEAGDLLTTSSVAGEAMKATDHQASQGAVLGKAMSELKNGQGLVLVLVNLQ